MIEVFYRASAERPDRHRPEGYSQRDALSSFLTAVENASYIRSVAFIVDGVVGARIRSDMESAGRVIEVDFRSNAVSFRYALSRALACDSPWVYLAEDDYIYDPASLSILGKSVREFTAGYVSLYDHPDRYTRSDDLASGKAHVRTAAGRHWRTAESTTMTFAADREQLLKDAWAFALGSASGAPCDRAIWRAVLHGRIAGLVGRSVRPHPYNLLQARCASGAARKVREAATGRLPYLWTPMPSLATHADDRYIAPFFSTQESRQDNG